MSFSLQTKLSSEVTTDEVKHKLLWPCLLCRVQDVPDSDGMYVQSREGEGVGGGTNLTGTNSNDFNTLVVCKQV